jgi:hypothetical protein
MGGLSRPHRASPPGMSPLPLGGARACGPTRMSPAQLARARRAEQLRSRLRDRVPRHVQHCYGTGCRLWWIYTWRRDDPAVQLRVPYLCNSWRCEHCRRHEAHVTFARIKEATAKLDPRGYLFCVLTLDRDGYAGGTGWSDCDAAYKALGHMQRLLFWRLKRWMRKQGMNPLGSEWVATVECHRSGWPHVNILLWSPELADYVREHQSRFPEGSRDGTLFWGDLLQMLTAAGWGAVSTIETPRGSVERISGYLVKLAALADRTSGELAKLTQLPTVAPVRFRRLRSGKGFLPARLKDERYTGTLVRRCIELDGTCTVRPLHDVPVEAQRTVERCCYAEERLAHEEFAAWFRQRRHLPRPPVTHLYHGRVVSTQPGLARLAKQLEYEQ